MLPAFELLRDGRRQIGAFHLPGDIFGIEIGDAHRFTAEAIVNTTVWIARRRSIFAEGVEENISSTKDVLKLIARNLHHTENHLMLLGRQTALERVSTTENQAVPEQASGSITPDQKE